MADDAPATGLLSALAPRFVPRAFKVYRLPDPAVPGVPIIPCLDHEAMLHSLIPPHIGIYLRDVEGACYHELVLIPGRRLLEIDVVSTAGYSCPDSRAALIARLRAAYPDHRIRLRTASLLRGDRRVSDACQAQAPLAHVLDGADLGGVSEAVGRLKVIGNLMEKESRVASWSVRTITGPALAVTAWLVWEQLDGDILPVGDLLRALIMASLGGAFLYLGLKAVHLTKMANRVFKRASEYALILDDRRRIAEGRPRTVDLST